jgi:pectate lyase
VLKVVADSQLFRMNAISVLDAAAAPGTGTGGTSSSTMQATTMSLATYAAEGTLIRLPSASVTGTASKAFGGAKGTYDMQVHVQAENDGRPSLEVHRGTTRLSTYTYPLMSGATSFSVKGVALDTGDVIKLVGRGDGGAYARVEKIVFTPAAPGTDPAPVPPPPTLSACANPSAGYEGFGRNTTGGAGQAVYRVTTLSDSGSGSLREALSRGNRCIVFDVGGTISLSSNLIVKGANITIDGLTAPSPGITLKNRTLVMQGSSGAGNVVVRGIRSRGTPSGEDAIRVYNASNIVIDRVSVSGFGDGAVDVTEKSRDVTIQWSILGNGNPSHNFSNLIGYEATRVTVHHNLYLNSDDRNPYCGRNGASSPSPETVCDVRNNLIWNYVRGTAVRAYGTANVVNNYYYTTKDTSAARTVYLDTGASAYVSGNFSKNGWNLNGNGNRSTAYAAVAPATTDALTAAQQVVAQAGARGPRFGLDAADQAYIGSISLQ